jgi:hypothetical protein
MFLLLGYSSRVINYKQFEQYSEITQWIKFCLYNFGFFCESNNHEI